MTVCQSHFAVVAGAASRRVTLLPLVRPLLDLRIAAVRSILYVSLRQQRPGLASGI